MHALAFEGVEVGGQRSDERLPFPSLHFGDFAVVQDDAADQLHVEVAHMQDTPAGFADDGEGFNEQIVERGALGDFFLEFDGLGGKVDIGEGLELRFQFVNGGNSRPKRFYFALVFGAENLCQYCVNHKQVSSGAAIQPLF